MTLPSSGKISLSDIVAEFGGAANHTTQSPNIGIPAGQEVAHSDYYGKSAPTAGEWISFKITADKGVLILDQPVMDRSGNTYFSMGDYDQNRKTVLKVGTDRQVKWRKCFEGAASRDFNEGAKESANTVSPNGSRLFTVDRAGVLQAFDTSDGSMIKVIKGPTEGIASSDTHVFTIQRKGTGSNRVYVHMLDHSLNYLNTCTIGLPVDGFGSGYDVRVGAMVWDEVNNGLWFGWGSGQNIAGADKYRAKGGVGFMRPDTSSAQAISMYNFKENSSQNYPAIMEGLRLTAHKDGGCAVHMYGDATNESGPNQIKSDQHILARLTVQPNNEIQKLWSSGSGNSVFKSNQVAVRRHYQIESNSSGHILEACTRGNPNTKQSGHAIFNSSGSRTSTTGYYANTTNSGVSTWTYGNGSTDGTSISASHPMVEEFMIAGYGEEGRKLCKGVVAHWFPFDRGNDTQRVNGFPVNGQYKLGYGRFEGSIGSTLGGKAFRELPESVTGSWAASNPYASYNLITNADDRFVTGWEATV